MKHIIQALSGFLLLTFTVTGSAAVITDLYGDKDGFGTGLTVADGSVFNIGLVPAVNTTGDAACTDVQLNNPGTILPCNTPLGTTSFSHTYDLTGVKSIVSASLELFTAGQGSAGPTTISVDGTLLGTLTNGDVSTLPFLPGIVSRQLEWREQYHDHNQLPARRLGVGLLRTDPRHRTRTLDPAPAGSWPVRFWHGPA